MFFNKDGEQCTCEEYQEEKELLINFNFKYSFKKSLLTVVLLLKFKLNFEENSQNLSIKNTCIKNLKFSFKKPS